MSLFSSIASGFKSAVSGIANVADKIQSNPFVQKIHSGVMDVVSKVPIIGAAVPYLESFHNTQVGLTKMAAGNTNQPQTASTIPSMSYTSMGYNPSMAVIPQTPEEKILGMDKKTAYIAFAILAVVLSAGLILLLKKRRK